MDRFDCHIISNTHWDREWRYPFQAYRMDLVDMMDRLLDLLEKRPDYKSFFLDSQSVILEDYLEIRPENETRIRNQVQSGRLHIGPWYTLPDQWACPGEALIRNLLMGHQVSLKFGKVSKIGYTPFSNGQISQLPQLYQGFEIDSCFFYRGIGKHNVRSEFIWEGPDGSQLFSFRFGDYARYNYYFLVYRPGLLGRFPEDREYRWNPDEIPFRVASRQFQDRQYSWIDQNLEVHEENLKRALEEAERYTGKDATTSQLLYMMGHDHSYAAEEELDLIEAAQNHKQSKDQNIFHSSLEHYLEKFKKEAKDLEILHGEMRHTNKEGLWTNLMALILSCRLYLKRQNALIDAKMLYQAEPLASCAWLTGSGYPRPFFDLAWKKLLINQAHDAIGGCSVDRVHEEMAARWGEVDTLCDEISRRSMRDIASRIDASGIEKKHLQLTVFNSLPYDRAFIGEFMIDLPHASPDSRFSIETPDGDSIPIQILSQEEYEPTIEGGYELPMPFKVQRYLTLLDLENLPSMGYEVYVIKPGKDPHTQGESIVKSDREMENDFLKVWVNDNGTLRMEDKQTGRILEQLGYFEDSAEFGDPWNRVQPGEDKPFYSWHSEISTEIIHQGPLMGCLKVSLELQVPYEKGEDNQRSKSKIAIPVFLWITLKKNSPLLEIKIQLDNQAKDHRLRMLFPSGIPKAEKSFAEGQFDVLSRPIQIPSCEGWKEKPYPTHPMWNFVDVSDGETGLSVINDGLIEYEVMDDSPRTIAITLLRTFGKFVFNRPSPGSQCLGMQEYRLALFSHSGYWYDTDLFRQTAFHNIPLQALISGPTQGAQPLCRSFIRFSPSTSVVSSTFKQSENENCLIFRIWNPLEEEQEVKIESDLLLEKVEELTLEEKFIRFIEVENSRSFSVSVAKKRIMTLGLGFKGVS